MAARQGTVLGGIVSWMLVCSSMADAAFLGLPAKTSQAPKPPGPSKPSIAAPSFRLYKMKTGEGLISVVVSTTTTDEQLKKLLCYFREKVRTGRFRDIGIAKPTSTNRSGRPDYGAGTISVFRGEKCANEPFLDSVGPCGYGEHDDAYYQWGVEGDPDKDEGAIRSKRGDLVPIFDYKDNWRPK